MLVDFFPLLLNHTYMENEPRWPELLTSRECFDLAWVIRDSRFFALTMFARALPSVRVRTGLRANFMATLRNQSVSERFEARAWQRTWRINKGASLFAKVATPNLGDLDYWYKEAFREPDWCAPYHAAYLKRFLALAQKHKIPVFWLVPPIHPDVQKRFTLGGTDRRFDQLLRSVLAQYPNVIIVDGRGAGYSSSVFVDHGHLDREGATLLSTDLSMIVKQTLRGDIPAGRWAYMPAFRVLSLDGPFEDIGQSRAQGDCTVTYSPNSTCCR